jgi:LPS O-antigen subunit length determinant protein (WzzB/FepE family)
MSVKEEKNVVDSKSSNFEIDKDDEINLYDLWKVIAKRKTIIIALFLISILGATIYCFTASPIYRVETYMKLYIPKDISIIKELPTGKDISSIIGKIDSEKRAVIFPKTADEITNAVIGEIRGVTDKFKITIESRNRENLPTALQEMITYIENIREIKSNYEKIVLEIDERIKNVKDADQKSDFQIKEIEKRLNTAKVLPVGFDPVAIRHNSLNLKMEKYRLEQEHQNYKTIQLLEDPFISKVPVWPKKAMILTIAGICSLIFGIFLSFIMQYFERMKEKAQCR